MAAAAHDVTRVSIGRGGMGSAPRGVQRMGAQRRGQEGVGGVLEGWNSGGEGGGQG